jgi:hypothetical protein
MILKDLTSTPNTDPSDILRLRDSIYAADLLITAIAHLDFFSWIDSHPVNFNSIVEHFKIKPRPADVMLTYFTALGFTKKENELYYLTEAAKEHLTSNSEWSLIPYFATQIERPIVEKMLEVLKSGEPANWGGSKNEQKWEDAMERKNFADSFTTGMDSRGAYFAPALASSFNFSEYNSLIDIAGGSGLYAACIKARHPSVKTALLEKPPVDKIAGIGLEKRGMKDKVEIIGHDMFGDELPKGFDIHLYSHVIHDWEIEQNRRLFKKSFESLNKNGIIMIHDAHINNDKNGPLSVAEFSVLLMFATRGKCYSFGEMQELLLSEGFVDINFQPTFGNRSIITGKKG